MRRSPVELEDLATTLDRYAAALYGFQIAVSTPMGDVDLAVAGPGSPEPPSPSELRAVYCTGKPLLALVAAQLVEAGDLSFDDQLGHILPSAAAGLRDVRVEELLSHEVGLAYPQALAALLVGEQERSTRILATGPDAELRGSTSRRAYSEVAGWHVLGAVVEQLTGEPWQVTVRSRILRPLELEREILCAPVDDLDLLGSRLRPHVVPSQDQLLPALFEGSPLLTLGDLPAFGYFATVRGLLALYTRLLDAWCGRVPFPGASTALVRQITAARSPRFDVVLNRRCSFGLGFMADLRRHGFGTGFGTSSFGHAGYGGLTGAAADPASGIVVAFAAGALMPPDTDSLAIRTSILEAAMRTPAS